MPQLVPGTEEIRQYYGQILQGNKDLKTNACCCTEEVPPAHKAALKAIPQEVLDRFYGCGSPIPPALEGCTVLDLGCGSGRDTFLASALVGPAGHVIGVDMTEEQLAVAKRNQPAHAVALDGKASGVSFRQGYIEDLGALGIEDQSIDVVISNCTINLSPCKEKVFSEIHRVLKPGGELFFSDVFASRRLPAKIAGDPLLRGECLGGALYMEDFRRILRQLGWPDYRCMSKSQVSIGNSEVERMVGPTIFWSMKIRAFKLSSLEDICEDYGQVATYLGTIPDHPNQFPLLSVRQIPAQHPCF